MSTFTGTIQPNNIEKIGFYFNKKHYAERNIATMLKESGGDIIMNASIFLSNGKPCCYLRADGQTKCDPGYGCYGLAWSNPPIDLAMVNMKGCTKPNLLHDCYLIYNGQKIAKPTYGADRAYSCNRTAVGIKDRQFAYFVTEDNYTPISLRDKLFMLGWSDCIMLDGGGSTTIWFKDGRGFIGSDPGRYIPFYLVIYLKHQPSTPITTAKNTVNPYAIPTTTLRIGSRGTAVKWLQWELGFTGDDVDGVFGQDTKKAVIAFQKTAFTSAKDCDGIVGSMTRAKLMV